MRGGPPYGPGGSRVSILYFSGTGGTKLVAELLGEILSESRKCDVAGIGDASAVEAAAGAEFLLLCYPTYYLGPPPSMREFVLRLGPFDPPRRAYVVTTCELYSENSIRRLALMLRERGILLAGSKVIRAPGSDATAVFPSVIVPWLYRFEKRPPEKLRAIAREVIAVSEVRDPRESIPPPQWYTPFTRSLQNLLDGFDIFRYRMRVLPKRCVLCGACVKSCDRKAWEMGEGRLVHSGERCELCCRCLHRCPRRAIVLVRWLKDNRRLDAWLYARLGAEARESLGLGAREESR